MLSIGDLINQIKSYNPNADFDLIKKSYNYGFNAHKGQYRASGEIYFTHPVQVAKIVIDLKLDESKKGIDSFFSLSKSFGSFFFGGL